MDQTGRGDRKENSAGASAANDVWNSDDGIRWNLVAKHAPWFPRTAQYSIAFNEKLWIFGGKTGTHYKQADDIWYMSKAGVQ